MPRTRSAFIIEDNEMLVRIYRSIFTALNCSVAHASTSEGALNLLDGKRPDLIVVDDQLADAFGVETVRAIRARDHLSNVLIIATSLTRSSLAERELRAVGVSYFVTKPWQIGSFSALAQRCLQARVAQTA